METLPAAASRLLEGRVEESIKFGSLQPTVRLAQNAGRIVYTVYVGRPRSSHADQDLIWARLVSVNGTWVLRLYPADNTGCMSISLFFSEPHIELAAWLQKLLELAPEAVTYLNTWEEKTKLLRGVIRIVLEELAGDTLTLGNISKETLRETNRRDREKLPLFTKSLFGNRAGLRPHYFLDLSARQQPPWNPGADSASRPKRLDQDRGSSHDHQESAKEKDNADEEKDKADEAHFENGTDTLSNLGQDKPMISTEGGAKEIVDIAEQDPNRSSTEARRNIDHGQRTTNSWQADAERLIVQPVKEKASSQIEEHLKSWLNGDLDEDALERDIRSSLSDVRLSRQMQDALIQSKSAAPAEDSQRSGKRKADQLDD